jgi:redox-sensing transcriptional repressor
LADYYGFQQTNFTVVALFDADEKKIGKKVGAVEIFDIKDFIRIAAKNKINVAIIAVPAPVAQSVLEQITKAGIKAVMNFAPIPLKVDGDVKMKTVDLTTSLESLSYFLAQPNNADGKK